MSLCSLYLDQAQRHGRYHPLYGSIFSWFQIASRAYINPNNLPLALESIWHLTYAHRPSVNLKLALYKMFHMWIKVIPIRWYSAYLHISSVYNLTYGMEAPEYVFGLLMRPGFLSLRNDSIVATIETHWVCDAKNHSKFCYELLDPNGLFYSIRGSDILDLYGRVGYCLLLGTLPTHSTSIQCLSPGSDWYRLVMLKVYETSGRVHSIAYMMDPIADA
ncbi:hypothetical protein CRG98_018779 [Punica granatum]|uniref:Uncharacterized protein n=1 Tax=Punica granatum TaxID=22663 RepID=A0A2I0JYA1_PUNGR|nr:hypothetical protein CRG98_018779 [Punica granatum]